MEPKKLKGEAIVCPFSDYLKEKKKWEDRHPDAIIKEEIKSTFITVQEVPAGLGNIKLQGMAQVQILMIICAIIFEEKELTLSDSKFSNEPGNV